MQIEDFSKKIKFIFPIVVLVVIVLSLIVNLIHIKYVEQNDLLHLEHRIILATKVSKLLHEIQKERGLSVGYRSNNFGNFQEELKVQTRKTNQEINNLKNYLKAFPTLISSQLTQILTAMEQLPKIRFQIQKRSLSIAQVSQYYTNINNMLLETVLNIAKNSHFNSVTNNSMAYVNLLYYEENLGLERATGTNILLEKIISQKKINLFNAYVVQQKIYKNLFLQYASKHIKELYSHYTKSEVITEVIAMRQKILEADTQFIKNMEPSIWFDKMTVFIDNLKTIDNHLAKDMQENIQNEYLKSKESFIIYIVLSIIIFIIFIMMIVIIVHLQRTEKKLKNLLNKYVISSTTDLKGEITGVSEAFCKISGYTAEELLGKPHNIVRHPDMPHELFEDMWKSLKNNKIWQGEIKNLCKDGSYYWVTAVVSPLYNNGTKVGYNSVRQDITDGKRIEELNRTLKDKIALEVAKSRQKDQQMIQQSRLAQMGEMISMIAHQWRQPLTAISATSGTLSLKAKTNALEADYVLERTKRISEYAEHLSATIDDFRDFFKPDKGKKETSFEELIESVLGIVGISLSQQNIAIENSVTYKERFTSYPNELKQVILNLIKNSEDILLEKGVKNPLIKLHAYKKDNTIILEVQDNGGGIEASIIDKIFDPYFSTKLKKDGTGLGLYMSKTIIEDHCKGKLMVENRDDGALFSIILKCKIVV